MSAKKKASILDDPEFQQLRSQKATISLALTAATLVVYFGFIFLVAMNKDFLATKLTENINIGIPLGVGVIVISWLLTGIYVRWANNTYDIMVENVKRKIGG